MNCFRLTVALLITSISTSGCGFFERSSTWTEEVVASDGFSIQLKRTLVTGPDEFFRPGRGGIFRSTISATVPNFGDINFDWDGYETPVTFDVVHGVPWVVLPLAGPNRCKQYNFPKDSVVAFYLRDKDWIAVPFGDAPNGLRQNILLSPPTNTTIVRASDQSKKGQFGGQPTELALIDGFIPKHIHSEHSCSRINPTQAPEQTQSAQQFINIAPKLASVEVREILTDTIRIDRLENYRGVLARNDIGAEVIVNNCRGEIGRVETIRPWKTGVDGSISSATTLTRIELLASRSGVKNIWLPSAKPNGGTPMMIRCIGTHGYALINQWGKSVDLVIAQFDLDGSWTNIWRVTYPEADFKSRAIIDFRVEAAGFLITVGEVSHANGSQGGLLATIGSRYVLRVSKN